jgi:acyl-coenzyme A thioesterase PaaI-like protein
VNYLEPGRPGLLLATAEVRRRGRLLTVVQAGVTRAEDGETVAEAMGTFTSTG